LLKTARQYDISKEAQERLKRIQIVTAAVTAQQALEDAVTPSQAQNDENITKHLIGNEDIIKESNRKDEKVGRDGVTAALPTTDIERAAVTDPSLAETTRYLNNFREEAAAKSKSKVAEIAEANESGEIR
jgi:hypothetical protein